MVVLSLLKFQKLNLRQNVIDCSFFPARGEWIERTSPAVGCADQSSLYAFLPPFWIERRWIMSKTTSEYTGGMKCLSNTLLVVFEHASIPLVQDQWYTQRIKFVVDF